MLRKIHLHGRLAKEFGTEPIELDVDNPTFLFSGLSCAFPNFERAFRRNSHYQILKVNREKETLSAYTAETLGLSFGDAQEIHVVPTVEGAGMEIAAAMGLAGFAKFAVGVLINIGVSMIMSSIAQKLAPSPTSSDAAVTAAERPSAFFTSPLNVTTPGSAVPLVYGRCLTSTVVISTGVVSEQI